jgi:hypothetical protein
MTEMQRAFFARIGRIGIAFALSLSLVGVNAAVVRADNDDPSCGPEAPSGPGKEPTKEEKEGRRRKQSVSRRRKSETPSGRPRRTKDPERQRSGEVRCLSSARAENFRSPTLPVENSRFRVAESWATGRA